MKKLFLPAMLTVVSVAFVISLGRLWDLSKSDWAAWVQAVGSVAAIWAAFVIAQRQVRHDKKLKAEAELAAARVVAANISFAVSVLGSSLTALKNNLAADRLGAKAFNLPKELAIVSALVVPTEEQCLVLAPVAVSCAISLARCLNMVKMIESNLGRAHSLEAPFNSIYESAWLLSVEPMVDEALQQTSIAQAALIDLHRGHPTTLE